MLRLRTPRWHPAAELYGAHGANRTLNSYLEGRRLTIKRRVHLDPHSGAAPLSARYKGAILADELIGNIGEGSRIRT